MRTQLLSGLGLLSLLCTGASAGDEPWSSLDRDIEALAGSPAAQGPDLEVRGLLRVLYGNASDTNGNLFPGVDDISGFAVERAQVEVEGSVEDYGFRIQLEAAGGVAALLDAYGTWRINDHVRYSMGNFRSPFLWESLLDDGSRVLILRTDAGELFYGRDVGAMLDGSYDRFHWAVAAQNGGDGLGDDNAITGRVGLDVLGQGVGMQAGAYGTDGEAHLTLNLAARDDASAPDEGDVFAADAQFQIAQFAANAQFISFGDDGIAFGGRSDSDVYAITATYMVVPDKYEIAVRFQDTDNITDDSEFTIGLNRYISGHDVKWQVNFASADSDDSSKEFDVILVGLNVRV